MRILCIGESFIDRYKMYKRLRNEPALNVPVCEYDQTIDALGGAGFMVNNLASLTLRPISLYSNCSRDYNRLYSANVLGVAHGDSTMLKERVYINHLPVLRFDANDSIEYNAEFINIFIDNIRKGDVVAISNYHKGMFKDSDPGSNDISRIALRCKDIGATSILDAKRLLPAYSDIDILKINEHCAIESTGFSSQSFESLSEQVAMQYNIQNVIVTQGQRGFESVQMEEPVVLFGELNDSADKHNYVDSIGAGDVFMAGLVHGISNGANLIDAAKLGNTAAGISCNKFGTTQTVSIGEVNG
jgi:bifunctional ADP-heptose synthase (sugar kinase/adenylyltransferase)